MASLAPTSSPGSNHAFTRFQVQPIAGALGAEIGDIDLSQKLDDDTVSELRRALLEYQVIFFRDQDLTVEQHKAFGRRFGTLNVHPQYVPLDGDPEIFPVIKEPTDDDNIGSVWHSDVTFLEAPALGSILYGIEVPEVGGDTMFANQYLAYESLSDGMKRLLDGMKALHSDNILSNPEVAARRNATRSTKIAEEAMGKPRIDNLHPVVRTHPETGRKSLFRQPRLHLALREHDRRGERAPTRIPLCARRAPGVHLSLPLAAQFHRLLGQPLRATLCVERLPRAAALHAPRDGERRTAAVRG